MIDLFHCFLFTNKFVIVKIQSAVSRDCGEMTARDDSMPRAPTCGSKPAILYAWAKDAPELSLPEGISLLLVFFVIFHPHIYFPCCSFILKQCEDNI